VTVATVLQEGALASFSRLALADGHANLLAKAGIRKPVQTG
jgi:hypothetical protein